MRVTLVLIVTVLLASAAFGDEAPLSNADVVRMLQAGLSAELVISKIQASAAAFDTSTGALVELAEAKVPEPVIRAMMAKPTTTAAAAPTPAPATAAAAAAMSGQQAAAAETVEVLAKDLYRTRGLCTMRGDLVVTKEGLRYTSTATTSLCEEYLSSSSFGVRWEDLKSICFEYAVSGTITVEERGGHDYSFKDKIPRIQEIEKRLKTLRPDAPYSCD
jgi:hypothetical protein